MCCNISGGKFAMRKVSQTLRSGETSQPSASDIDEQLHVDVLACVMARRALSFRNDKSRSARQSDPEKLADFSDKIMRQSKEKQGTMDSRRSHRAPGLARALCNLRDIYIFVAVYDEEKSSIRAPSAKTRRNLTPLNICAISSARSTSRNSFANMARPCQYLPQQTSIEIA